MDYVVSIIYNISELELLIENRLKWWTGISNDGPKVLLRIKVSSLKFYFGLNLVFPPPKNMHFEFGTSFNVKLVK